MRTEQEFDIAFEAFKRQLDGMDNATFFAMLGTSIDELREKCVPSRIKYKCGMNMTKKKSNDYVPEYETLCA